jgi:hypothetical protein
MSFNPNLGRWLEIDPEIYQAGDTDLYRFVGDNPVTGLDPSGLKRITMALPHNSLTQLANEDDWKGFVATGERGAFFWPVDFFLKQRADKKGGWVIQEINAWASGLLPKNLHLPALGKTDRDHYWEAFRVQPNSDRADQYSLPEKILESLKKSGVPIPKNPAFTDVYWMTAAPVGSSGSLTIEGRVFFVDCNNDDPPKGFDYQNTPLGPGALPFTREEANVKKFLANAGSQNIGPQEDHSIKITWTKDKPHTEVVWTSQTS